MSLPPAAVAVEGIVVDWDRRRELFSLDPQVVHLNHGSFGAVPIPVQRAQQRLRDEMEADPTAFFTRGLLDRLAHARRHLASFVGADPAGTALVPNATAATQVVLGSLDLRPADEVLLTDHVYGAIRLGVERACARAGATVTQVDLPLDGTDDDVVELVVAATRRGRTRVAVIDEVTSATAKLLPVDRLVAALHERDVLVVVDAAHAPAMLPVDVARTAADFWLGNLHKWAFAPRPTALLAVAAQHRTRMRPLVVSWQQHQGYPTAQEFAGTLDYTPWLAAPAGVHLFRTLDPDRIRRHNNELAAHGQRLVASALAATERTTHQTEAERRYRAELERAADTLLGDPRLSMRLVPLPPAVADEAAAMTLRSRLAVEHGIEVAVAVWRDRAYLRLSAQIYNRVEDYGRLARALMPTLRAA